MAKRQSKIDNMTIPIITCPECSGSCYPMVLQIRCEKCEGTYDIDTNIFSENTKFVTIKSDELDRYMSYLLTEKTQEFTVVYKGQVLSTLDNLKRMCGFPTLLLVVKYITEGFIYILNEMSRMPGEKIYLVDDLGNKSKELKSEFLRKAYDAFNEEHDKGVVNKFIHSLSFSSKDKNTKNGDEGNNGDENKSI